MGRIGGGAGGGGCRSGCGRAAARPRSRPSSPSSSSRGGDKKINVIKEVRTIISGLGIKEAKDLVEAGGKAIKEGVTKEEAAKIKKQLEDQGAIVEVK